MRQIAEPITSANRDPLRGSRRLSSIVGRKMKTKRRVAVLTFTVCLICGCMTPYGQRMDELERKLQAGEISEAEYEAEMKKMRDAQPWGTKPDMYDDNTLLPKAHGTVSFP